MKKKSLFLSVVIFVQLLLGGCGASAPAVAEKVIYQNPIGEMTDIGDPYVLKDKDMYYMYATSEPDYGFRVWTSPNLVDWEDAGMAYDHIEQEEDWAFQDFWAPEVIKFKKEYIMVFSGRTYSGSLRLSLARSKSPLGPFIDESVDFIHEEGSYIDGHIYIDDDGTPYLYYVKDNSENIVDGKQVSHVYVQQMNPEITDVVGEPVFLFGPDQVWEGLNRDMRWNEGPNIVKHEGIYYLLYSANLFASSQYGIGYATSDSPLGPFTKNEDNPILSSDLTHGISGPGHNSVTVGLDNETLYAVYHVHTDPNVPSGDRRPAIDRLYFDEEGNLKIDGPSWEEKELH